MKFLRTASVLVLSAFVLTGCDDTNEPEITVADLEGTWDATQFEYTDNENPAFSVDVISGLGGTLTIDVASSGSFDGSLNISGDTISVDFDAMTESYGLVSDFDAAFDLNGDVLAFSNDDVSYDFPDQLEQGAGLEPRGEVSATVDVELQR